MDPVDWSMMHMERAVNDKIGMGQKKVFFKVITSLFVQNFNFSKLSIFIMLGFRIASNNNVTQTS